MFEHPGEGELCEGEGGLASGLAAGEDALEGLVDGDLVGGVVGGLFAAGGDAFLLLMRAGEESSSLYKINQID